MKTIHLSAECYPIAKVGGLADVVAALPKYQQISGLSTAVVMPFYNIEFTKEHSFKDVYKSTIKVGEQSFDFTIKSLDESILGFPVFLVAIPNLLFKDIYTENDTDRFLAFQIAALDWILTLKEKPTVIHCHDHHTGLVPFMISNCYKYEPLKDIPTVFTIHNAQYQGWFSHHNVGKIPEFDFSKVGLLDWDSQINPLAAAIKCAHRVTTVSPTYLKELKQHAFGLESLLNHEHNKCVGILNGIDTDVWNTEKDTYLATKFKPSRVQSGKKANKKWICDQYGLNIEKPLFIFIGRLVYQKAGELLPAVADYCLKNNNLNMLFLGSGDYETENRLNAVNNNYTNTCGVYMGYNESLAHKLYAGADFLLMPSRFEPCGLNQMYALKYGTIPIVTKTGGLNDTVTDVSEEGGFGFCHNEVTVEAIYNAIQRAIDFYENNTKEFRSIRKKIIKIDHSWATSVNEYINLYTSLK